MKVSYNWLKAYLNLDLQPNDLGDLLTSLGLEVEGLETYESVKGGLRGIVTGHVTSCAQHPNADKLSVTTVDVGGEEDLNIVCGAPNVAKGQKVLVATVGTKLYDAEGKEWKISKAKIRGERSEGMICAEDELGLGESHDGIMVLDPNTDVGIPASELFDVETDQIYDIGLTPNRSDATAHLGVARDLLAALRVRNQDDQQLKVIEHVEIGTVTNHDGISVDVIRPDLCPRFSMLLLKSVKIGPSPTWMKNRLESIGVRSINNVVDITNFILHEYGQPLHAYDYDKLQGGKIIVDVVAGGSKFTALDEIEREMHAEDLMICDVNHDPIGIAGVFGGASTGVTENTATVLLEAAHFDSISVRKTSTRHNLRTEAAKCFEKGSDPAKTTQALQRAAYLLKTYAEAEIQGEILDVYPEVIAPKQVAITYEYINRLAGNHISPDEIKKIILAMDMKVLSDSEEGMTIEVPTDKADVTRPADILEEVLRVYGYDHIHPDDKLRQTLIPSDEIEPFAFREMIATYLSSNGFLQMMNLSLSQSKYYEGSGYDLVPVLNTSNVHLDIMRPEMLISGLEAVSFNVNRRQTDLKLFEFGKTYLKSESEYAESERLAIYVSGQWNHESWRMGSMEAGYYELKGAVEALLARFGLDQVKYEVSEDDRFEFAMDLVFNQKVLGTIGKVKGDLLKKVDLKQRVFAADMHLDVWLKGYLKTKVIFTDINKFPSTRRDLALVVSKGIKYNDLKDTIVKRGKKLVSAVNLFDVYENDEQLGADKRSYAVSIEFEHPEKTLTDKEVDKTLDKILYDLKSQWAVELR